MKKIKPKHFGMTAIYPVLFIALILITGCAKTEPEIIVRVDSPQLPARGFFYGIAAHHGSMAVI
jgi:hypothetical protein